MHKMAMEKQAFQFTVLIVSYLLLERQILILLFVLVVANLLDNF